MLEMYEEENMIVKIVHTKRRDRLATLLIFTLLYTLIVLYIISKDKFTSKEDIQNQLVVAINNQATIDVIKNIYQNRTSIEHIYILLQDKNNYYNYNDSLSQILNDIKTKFYLKDKSSIDINKTKIIIEDYLLTNPYDSLETSQKDVFINIRQKLDNNQYEIIKNDLEKIAKEITQQNNLVNQYLKDSTNSFWISISALVFSAILGLYQLYLGREERHRQIISEELQLNSKYNNQ
jgi:hypothetical protein